MRMNANKAPTTFDALTLTALFFLCAASVAPGATFHTNMNPTRTGLGPLAPSVDNSTFWDAPSNNAITINAGVGGSVYGGIAVDENAASADNAVTVNNTGAVELRIGSSTTGSGVIVGGWSRNGPVTGNTVTISAAGATHGVRVDGIVYGGEVNENVGRTVGNRAEGNRVILSGLSASAQTTMRNNIYGAYSGGISDIIGNTVVIGEFVTVRIVGSSNKIIAGGYDSVYGADSMEARGNTVTIKANALVEGTPGSRVSIYGGRMHTGSAQGNTVVIEGGTINYAEIFGGQNNNISDGDIHNNTVTLTGGTLTDVALYGGWAGRRGNSHHNEVTIGGATTDFNGTVDVYGGRSGGGEAFGNIITIGNDATGEVRINNVYGGLVASAGSDAFRDNTLNKNSGAAAIGAVRNVEFVNFGYAGAANIGSIDTTPTGSFRSGVTVAANAGDVAFDGVIGGLGSLTKTGGGAFIVTGSSPYSHINNQAGVIVREGVFQLGNGGATGNIITPQYAVDAGAVLAFNRSDDVVYGGLIHGDGTLKQEGVNPDWSSPGSKLILTGDGNRVANVNITSGTLQLGNGGETGGITASDSVTIAPGAFLAYNHSNNVTDGQIIKGGGTVIQRGSGALELTVTSDGATRNLYTGGTEIESGLLYVGGIMSYNQATDVGFAANNDTKAGYITFTGASGVTKIAALGRDRTNPITMRNSFRTESGAGDGNYVDLGLSPRITISGINLTRADDTGGAFYVADGTTMNVGAFQLLLQNNHVNYNGTRTLNDLHVESGGTFNLLTAQLAIFKSGISGTGTLNLEAYAPHAVIQLLSSDTGGEPSTFAMGTTNLIGTAANPIVLNLARAQSDATHDRVQFTHTGAFNSISGGDNSVTVIGDGIIRAASINIGNGTHLVPYRMDPLSAPKPAPDSQPGPDTLTLDAPQIALDNFTLTYVVTGKQSLLENDAQPLPPLVVKSKNTSLLDLDTHAPLAISDSAFSGIVDIMQQVTGDFDPTGDYLIMRSPSDGAFRDMENPDLEGLKVYVGGAEFKPTNEDLRGSVKLMFGGDPGDDGDPATDSVYTDDDDATGYKNVWLAATNPNSLTMAWTGGASEAAPADHLWTDSDSFLSWQKDASGGSETKFLGGDKVHIFGTDSFTVQLPAPSASASSGFGGKLIVSGFVAGRSVEGTDTSGGVYTIAGAGGITANAGSAFGRFLDDDTDDDRPLTPTGKLEKFGDNTLSFENTGGNLFMDGIELSGGTTSFTRADQLTTWSSSSAATPEAGDSTHITGSGAGITFKENATLEAREDITLSGEWVKFDAGPVTGTFSVAEGKTLTIGKYVGPDSDPSTTANSIGPIAPLPVSVLYSLSNDSVFNKAGPGTVRLESDDPADFFGRMDVSAGLLRVDGDYGNTAGFAVKSGGTLSGTGTIGAGGLGFGIIEDGGTLKPDGLAWSPDSGVPPVEHPLTITGDGLEFNAASSFVVRLAEYYGSGTKRYSDRVDVVNGVVSIDPAATLAVGFDYYKLQLSDTVFYTIIDAAAAPAPADRTKFTLASSAYLPRGVTMEHGWGLDAQNFDLYQIGARYNPDDGFSKIPDLTHNENEVGNNLDWIIKHQDPGMGEVVDRVSDPGLSDGDIRRQLDELSGDLVANAFYMAFKEPWRHPFNRLGVLEREPASSRRKDEACPPAPAAGVPPRIWAEITTRLERVDYDGNAHGFDVRRHGIALGADRELHPDLFGGVTFQYSNPRLDQDTGDVEADDFEFGLYAMARLLGGLDAKAYFGISRQFYDFGRTVSLPATPSGKYGPLNERLDGHTDGSAVAASIELIRPVPLPNNVRLLPIAGFDFEMAWIDGFRESSGKTSLAYEDASMRRSVFRFGLGAEFETRNALTLNARAQYMMRVDGGEHPSIGARFANVVKSGQPAMDIWGARSGRNWLNLGVGAGWRPGGRDDRLFYLNYDLKVNRHMTSHAGEAGFMIMW